MGPKLPASSDEQAPAHDIRGLLHRKVLAAYRHRAGVARRLGMTESEVTALAHLAQGVLTPGQLATRLQLTSGGVTALLHRLERQGWVRREPHPRDRRSVVLHADVKVLAAIAELYSPLARDLDALVAALSERERRIVAAYLEEVALVSERCADELVSPTVAEPDDEQGIDPAMRVWA